MAVDMLFLLFSRTTSDKATRTGLPVWRCDLERKIEGLVSEKIRAGIQGAKMEWLRIKHV
jgi:hypothetical protein